MRGTQQVRGTPPMRMHSSQPLEDLRERMRDPIFDRRAIEGFVTCCEAGCESESPSGPARHSSAAQSGLSCLRPPAALSRSRRKSLPSGLRGSCSPSEVTAAHAGEGAGVPGDVTPALGWVSRSSAARRRLSCRSACANDAVDVDSIGTVASRDVHGLRTPAGSAAEESWLPRVSRSWRARRNPPRTGVDGFAPGAPEAAEDVGLSRLLGSPRSASSTPPPSRELLIAAADGATSAAASAAGSAGIAGYRVSPWRARDGVGCAQIDAPPRSR
ncbi:hypothetical protein JKP88DRAFT_279190 [Tribonema minus]|uniref:Uncharacterized protein n=1 Tax=Tribonema minus TaxID=303371 RepID=A0A835YU09_9STRA|nr:hypothetical protein JKP88DRAFT_279190 [Tribonema minus]